MNINYKTKTDILLEDIKGFNIGKAEKEYMDCLIHIIERLQKQLNIATKALEKINNPTIGDIYNKATDEIDYNLVMDIAQKALKEMEEV